MGDGEIIIISADAGVQIASLRSREYKSWGTFYWNLLEWQEPSNVEQITSEIAGRPGWRAAAVLLALVERTCEI